MKLQTLIFNIKAYNNIIGINGIKDKFQNFLKIKTNKSKNTIILWVILTGGKAIFICEEFGIKIT